MKYCAVLGWLVFVIITAVAGRIDAAPLPSPYGGIFDFTSYSYAGTGKTVTIGFYSTTKCFVDWNNGSSTVADYVVYPMQDLPTGVDLVRVQATYMQGDTFSVIDIKMCGFNGSPGSYTGTFRAYWNGADANGQWQQTLRYGYAASTLAKTTAAIEINGAWIGSYFDANGQWYAWEPGAAPSRMDRWCYRRTGKDTASLKCNIRDGSYLYLLLTYTAPRQAVINGFYAHDGANHVRTYCPVTGRVLW